MCERSDSCDSVPDYRVYETKDGRLVNPTLHIEYPNRPLKDKKLFDGYLLKKNNTSASESSSASEASSTSESSSESSQTRTSSTCSNHHHPKTERPTMITETELNKTKYFGPSTKETINKKLKANDFMIFSSLRDSASTSEIAATADPSKLPLLLAYRSSNDKIYYLPIKHEKSRWWIEFPNGNEKTDFSSIQNLVNHYYTYQYMDIKTGTIEMFPLNLLENDSQ
uniref:SH2 domain-containing protein n=1 Tax=Panagrolaimus sp. PS1159 TaxID=55785 RepID=A0AC35EWC9_9BILA